MEDCRKVGCMAEKHLDFISEDYSNGEVVDSNSIRGLDLPKLGIDILYGDLIDGGLNDGDLVVPSDPFFY